jgi:hypothetical protein
VIVKRRNDFIAGAIFFGVAAYATLLSYEMDLGSIASPEAGFIPLVVAVLLLIASSAFIIATLRPLPKGLVEAETRRLTVLVPAVIFSAADLLLLYLLGMWLATVPALMVLYLKAGGKSVIRSALFAVVAVACAYALFVVAFQIEFPQGILLSRIL